MICYKIPRIVCIASAFLAIAGRLPAEDGVRIYPAPAGEALAPNFTVTVEDKNAPVYVAKVASADPALRWKAMDDRAHSDGDHDETAFVCFDLQGRAGVCVTCSAPVRQAKILPTSSGIVPVIDGRRVRFTLAKPGNLTLEINSNWVNALHLFANPMEKDAPRPDDPNVIYYGPGIHEVDEVQVFSGKTVYVAGGAVVRGTTSSGKPGGSTFRPVNSCRSSSGRSIGAAIRSGAISRMLSSGISKPRATIRSSISGASTRSMPSTESAANG